MPRTVKLAFDTSTECAPKSVGALIPAQNYIYRNERVPIGSEVKR